MRKLSIVLCFLAVCSVFVYANGQTDSSSTAAVSMEISDAKESPILAEMVAAGDLPQLSDRLPLSPLLETVNSELGDFGGVMRKAWRGAGKDKWGVTKMMEEYLLRYEDGKIVPNVAKSFEISDDYKVFTFRLREGMKWSDGVDFTANDVMFYWEEILQKNAHGKGISSCLKGATVTKIDDYAFSISFEESNYLFPISFIKAREFFTPAHYAKSILPEYIGLEKANAMATAQGFSDAQAMVQQKLYYFWLYADVPKLTAWIPQNDINSSIFKMTRNPYYWKVDANGKQLPYIDAIEYTRIEDTSALTLKAISGELDFQTRGMQSNDFTILKENENKSGYKVAMWNEPGSIQPVIFNPTVEDAKLRELFSNPKFRKAVSLCFDRNEINEIAYNGMREPIQACLSTIAPNYDEEWANAYVEQDTAKAADLLDEIGLKWDNSKTFRTFADGSRLEIIFQHRLDSEQELAYIELLVHHMNQIGLHVIPRQIDRTLYEQLRESNKLGMTTGSAPAVSMVVESRPFVPSRKEEVQWAQYGEWVNSKGEKGIKPVGAYADLVDYWNKVVTTPEGPERDEWIKKIVELHKENLFIIGIVSDSPNLAVFNKNMMNVPEHLYVSDILRTPGNAKPWQFFYKN